MAVDVCVRIYSIKSYINSRIDLLNGNISRALKEEKD